MNAAGSSINADAIGTQLDETPCPEHGADSLVARIAGQQSRPVDVQVLDDLLRAARFYCDREGVESRSNYANDMLERGEKCIAAVAELIEAASKFRAAQKAVEAGATLRKYRRRDSAGVALDAALANVGSAS
jgi:hypothetical protein